MKTNEIYYRGYTGSVEWSDEDERFIGEVKGITADISYEGKTIEELKEDFKNAIDEEFKYWQANGLKPEVPYKGSLNVRIGQQLHKCLAQRAEIEKTSINNLIKNAIIMYLNK